MSIRKQSFMQGAVILLIAGLVNRLLGFIPRIVLPRMIGAEGVGIFQLVFPFMIVLLTIVIGGIPLTVAKLVAESDAKNEQRKICVIRRIAMAFSLSLALTAGMVCLLLSKMIATKIMTDPRVFTSFLVMIPVVPLAAVSSVWRGYFQGKMNMIPSAISQTAETMVRIASTLGLAVLLIPYGLEIAAAAGMIGMVIGELAGLLVLWTTLQREKKKLTDNKVSQLQRKTATIGTSKISKAAIVHDLLHTAIPVTGGRMISSFSYLFEAILTTRSLFLAGITTAAATAQYGQLQGMVIPLLLLPGALNYSLSTSLIPSLSEAASRGDKVTIHTRLHQAMRLSIVTGAPFVVILSLLAEPICQLLYGSTEMSLMLRSMAPAAIFLYLQAPLQAALQALNRPGTALFNTFLCALIKLVLILQLATKPALGIYGVVLAITINFVLVTILHWFSVSKFIGFGMNVLDIVKVGGATLIMAAFTLRTWEMISFSHYSFDLCVAISVGVVGYLILLIPFKIIAPLDFSRMKKLLFRK